MSKRSIVLDVETTGLYVSDGHRMTEIGMIELIDGKPTGVTYHSYINPERDVPEFITELTGLTAEFLSDKPTFSDIAQDVRDFIGDDDLIITCRHSPEYTLDIAFLTHELKGASVVKGIKDTQWINVRKWSEAMFGNDEAKLDKVLDRYNIDRTERDENGHGALLDAALLAKVYPKLRRDYDAFLKASKSKNARRNIPKSKPKF